MPRQSNSAKSAATAATLVHQLRHFIAGVILYNQRVADQLGLHPTDMQSLHLLELLGPMTPGRLAECTGLTTGGVTVMLDRLEKAGYARRERNPDDRRSVLVHLNTAKMARVGEYYGAINDQLGRFLAAYPQRELETVVRFLTRINSIRTPPIKASKEKKP
ncbi:MAG TPA: MarR family transcriptional regulator [Silvibacterium sp.]|jgi:DNA-binding MarR family transcriptional regulator|nr:MarR family transcriptional regulator [Silvibacterium sp.]